MLAALLLATLATDAGAPRRLVAVEIDVVGFGHAVDSEAGITALVRLCRTASGRTEAMALSAGPPELMGEAVRVAHAFAAPPASGRRCRVARLLFDDAPAAAFGPTARVLPPPAALRLCDGCRRPRGAQRPAGVREGAAILVRACVDARGDLRTAAVVRSAGAAADAAALAEATRWQFRPLEIDGVTQPWCSHLRVQF